jgi:aminoglycoside 6'-N-acetyltransferase I
LAQITILGPGDQATLRDLLPEVFDLPLRGDLVREFLGDPRHHLAVAVDHGHVVGFASAVHYIHPDKDAELWINEVGVAPGHRRVGLGKELLRALFRLGRGLGCREAWVLTERDNNAARGLYEALGGVEPSTETVMFSFVLDPPPTKDVT